MKKTNGCSQKILASKNVCSYNEDMSTEITNNYIEEYTTQEKLQILADAAKYDVACTSSGSDRRGKKGELGNAAACGICHSFASDGRCISLLKILMTNHCVYDCKYCINRASNDVKRATFTPQEICELTVEFYKRNYIEGLFLSSGVLKNPTYTMEKMCETLLLLRTKYHFNGYIHVKTIPGASDELLAAAGYLADRISVNMELPTEEGLRTLAPNKTMQTILDPMGKVRNTIASHRMAIGKSAHMERSKGNQFLKQSIFGTESKKQFADGLMKEKKAGKIVADGAVVQESRSSYGNKAEEENYGAGSGGGIGWALVDDITHAEIKEEKIINARHYHTIQEVKNGEGPHPIKTDKGWLHLAHGVRGCASGLRYVLYMYMTSLEDPTKVIAEPGGYLLVPEGPEYIGDVMNVVFANGWIADEDGKVFIYYASSDTRMHVATSTIDRLVDYCMNTPKDDYRTQFSVEKIKALVAKNKQTLSK